MKINPFIAGNRVYPDQFVNRKSEINNAVSLILTGQSFAFVGDPRSGKTSLLLYLQAPEIKSELYGKEANRLVFFYQDLQSIPDDVTAAQYWNQALQLMIDTVAKKTPKSLLMTSYRHCASKEFSTSTLEPLFIQAQKEGWHLILLLDEFDTLLQHPVLNSTEFYGGLRTLATRYGNAISIVLSSRQTISEINEKTQTQARSGSPFLNFLKEFPVLPFPRAHAHTILNQSGRRFSIQEKEYLLDIAGHHAYFLQVSGSALWDAYENGYPPQERLVFTGREALRSASVTLERIWQHWTPDTRKAFTIIAIDEMPTLLGINNFDTETLRESLLILPRELRYLRERGIIMEDKQLPSGYCVTAKVILWWLAEELLIALQRKDELGQLLYLNQWNGLFTKGEQKQFSSAISSLGTMAKTGVEVFIKVAAEGFGKGISGK